MNHIELVVFDLAGTTVKADGQVAAAFVSALALHGIEATPEELSRVRGSSKRQAVLSFVPEGPSRERVAAAIYDSFRKHLARSFSDDGVEAIDGAERTFHWLKERGVR